MFVWKDENKQNGAKDDPFFIIQDISANIYALGKDQGREGWVALCTLSQPEVCSSSAITFRHFEHLFAV